MSMMQGFTRYDHYSHYMQGRSIMFIHTSCSFTYTTQGTISCMQLSKHAPLLSHYRPVESNNQTAVKYQVIGNQISTRDTCGVFCW